MPWKKSHPSLVAREDIIEFFNTLNMRESKTKICVDDSVKAVTIGDTLYIQAYPLFDSDILFVEQEGGTQVVHLHNNTIKNSFTLKNIYPRQIITRKGSLLPEDKQRWLAGKLTEEFDIELFKEEVFNSISPDKKFLYIKETWKLSHTLAFKLIV